MKRTRILSAILVTLVILLISFLIYINYDKILIAVNNIVYYSISNKIDIPGYTVNQRNYEFKTVKPTSNFYPKNIDEVKDVYYTVLNNGWDSFTFYCDKDYTNCKDDIKDIANDSEYISLINNYVSPFNAYKKYKDTVPDNIDFRLAIPDDGGDESVDVDENRLDIIFNNLLTNAVKYTKEGSITIGWQRATGRYDVEIYVEDTGCGLADDDAKMVFNRFYKKDKFQQGTGLGLSICKAVAIRLDGDIKVKSKLGEGTRFSVFLN